jgi:hypothetical protein
MIDHARGFVLIEQGASDGDGVAILDGPNLWYAYFDIQAGSWATEMLATDVSSTRGIKGSQLFLIRENLRVCAGYGASFAPH